MRWQPLLAEIRALKLSLARIDPRAGMPVLPPGGASPGAIAAVERRLGQPLPPSYRELLAQHDGLPSFYQGASLLGARPLSRGTYLELARLCIETSPGAELVPFGVDGTGETIFAWDVSATARDGELPVVVWMNEIGERVDSFPSFLELVLEMLGGDVAERQRVAEPRRRAAIAPPILRSAAA
jgi:hypothetical protein